MTSLSTLMAPASDPLAPIVIVGPTASGKSALAAAIAAEFATRSGDRGTVCEIVSVDSMQVYRGMDIGTAKASAAEQAAVPHHMIDLLDPDDEASVAWFQSEANAALAQIRAAGNRALLVGGTGLYHRAVVDGLEIPGQFPEVLAQVEQEADTSQLHARLTALDPDAAARMEPTNRRRIVRALEVTLGSGRPFSSFGPGLEHYPQTSSVMVGLSVPRSVIGPRVSSRVDHMMAVGFLAEVEHLHHLEPPMSRTAAQALGYRELLAVISGELSLSDAVETIKIRTRQFAVRQDRWFRRDPRIRWFDHETPSLARDIADTVLST